MSAALHRLWDKKALKPAPSLWEAARSHVPFVQVGLQPAPEPLMLSGLGEDGISVLIGPSGAGKSNVLAHTAEALLETAPVGRRLLPIFVPVAGRSDVSSDVREFGAAATLEVFLALKNSLGEYYRVKLDTLMAERVETQHSGQRFNAGLAAKIFGGGPEVGFELASDIVTVTAIPNRPDGGLNDLANVCRARGRELILLIEDTDGWARAPGGLELARAFFGSVAHPIHRNVDVPVAIAVQDSWVDQGLAEVDALVEAAVSVAHIPSIGSTDEARALIEAVLKRRVAFEYGDEPAPAVAELFTEKAISHLAGITVETRSVRKPLAAVRDTLDRFLRRPARAHRR